MTHARRRLASVVLPSGALLAACGADLDDRPQDVSDFRVLAVCADTPEIFLQAVSPAGPASVNGWPYTVTATPPPVTLTGLVLDPRAPAAEYTWRARACHGGASGLCDDPDNGPVVELATGRGPAAALAVTFAPTAEQLNAWIASRPELSYGSLYLQVEIDVERVATPELPAESLLVNKIVTYTYPAITPAEGQEPPPPPLPNTNPLGFTLTGRDEGPVLDAASMPLSVQLAPGQIWDTVVTLTGDDPPYAVARFPESRSEKPGYEILEERLFLTFFSTAGEWAQSTVTNRNVFGEIDEIEAKYTAPTDPAEFPVTLYFVQSDDRGGCTVRPATVERAGSAP
jgi:hypothetical protein